MSNEYRNIVRLCERNWENQNEWDLKQVAGEM